MAWAAGAVGPWVDRGSGNRMGRGAWSSGEGALWEVVA
jgi:hypothetical protein